MAAEFPSARGARLDWSAMPQRLQAAVAEQLGGAVVEAVTQPEGFSPAVAARVRTEAGARAFVKAVPPDVNPDTPNIYRREIAVVRELPDDLPRPRLVWSLDEGPDGWVVLVFEELAADHPALPWRRDQLDRTMASLAHIARTPAPAWLADQPASEWIAAHWRRWSWLAEHRPPGLDEWSRRHAERLAGLEQDVADAVDGDALVHLDVRWDNLLVDTERAWVLDWPWARRGAWWVDAMFFAPTVEMQGGPPAEEVFARHVGRSKVDGDAVVVAMAAAAGMLTDRSLAPPPPGLPTLRPFQVAAAAAFRAWLRRLTGWD
jgi:hypothetical protein